jgi:signal transduction histidine kinase
MDDKPHVLIVDDEPGIRSACKQVILDEGWDALEAANGEQALERLGAGRFDVVLTDLIMGSGIDGVELLREVRARAPKASVILMTSYPTLDTAVQALRDGANDYLLKPFNGDAVVHAIRRCWDLARLNEELQKEKNLREELSSAYGELQRLEKLKSDFTARVSHELRTPLASILTSMELLGVQQFPPETMRLLDILGRNIKKLKGSVDELLAFSDLENGRLRCRRRDMRLDEALASVVEHFRPLWEERKLDVKLQVEEDARLIWADPELLGLAMKHLFANAVIHNIPKGTVDVRIAKTTTDTVLQFTSTCRPLPPEEMTRIFDSFYQIGDSLTREAGGLGLGLTIVKQAIRLHGGVINASHNGGGKITFVATLPHQTAKD